MELIKLTAKKVKVKSMSGGYLFETHFYKADGKRFATIPSYQRQPKSGIKTITLNCFKYSLIWDNEKLLK